ncbi:hypothetical protein MNBD_GAMMA11-766 [hydrothermal vent metagenome]|uniref:Uncharacterized protein n=1 Tax=hydrothermal vent metagenome TaxID=652676 RepID=A0A3B0XEN9_9ZZZZ
MLSLQGWFYGVFLMMGILSMCPGSKSKFDPFSSMESFVPENLIKIRFFVFIRMGDVYLSHDPGTWHQDQWGVIISVNILWC